MNTLTRLELGDKVEIMDRASPDFGKTGEVADSECQPLTIINLGGNPIRSGVKVYCRVKLEDTEMMVDFFRNQLRRIHDRSPPECRGKVCVVSPFDTSGKRGILST